MAVSFGELGRLKGPWNGEGGIVPSEDVFAFWIPWRGDEVGDGGWAVWGGEAMSEALGKVDLGGEMRVVRAWPERGEIGNGGRGRTLAQSERGSFLPRGESSRLRHGIAPRRGGGKSRVSHRSGVG